MTRDEKGVFRKRLDIARKGGADMLCPEEVFRRDHN